MNKLSNSTKRFLICQLMLKQMRKEDNGINTSDALLPLRYLPFILSVLLLHKYIFISILLTLLLCLSEGLWSTKSIQRNGNTHCNAK